MKGLKFAVAAVALSLITIGTSGSIVFAEDIKTELTQVATQLETVSKTAEETNQQLAQQVSTQEKLNIEISFYDQHTRELTEAVTLVKTKMDLLDHGPKAVAPIQAMYLILADKYLEVDSLDLEKAVNGDLDTFRPYYENFLRSEDKATIKEALEAHLSSLTAEIAVSETGRTEAKLALVEVSSSIEQLSGQAAEVNGQVQLLAQEKQSIESEIKAKEAEEKKANSFIKPTSGRITSPFGNRKHPITRRITFHEGIDIANSTGTRILASRNGKVTFAGYQSGLGKVIKISHGSGIETVYAHLSAIQVSVGQSVTQGQQIGKMGSTGRSTGPHLHFEIRINGTPVNPSKYI